MQPTSTWMIVCVSALELSEHANKSFGQPRPSSTTGNRWSFLHISMFRHAGKPTVRL
ncbi:hypothetical protein XFF6970_610002 [Xanthomonas citri pv. fuscans]|nr:hypothetical protein XFF6970_610002 [Xanthomonas citri pv. fuscans]